MTTTLGLSFSARSVAKKFILFALNFTILLLGVACSGLCLYQVKLMPANYEGVIVNLKESNMTDLAAARTAMFTPQPATYKLLVTTKKPKGRKSSTIKQTTKPTASLHIISETLKPIKLPATVTQASVVKSTDHISTVITNVSTTKLTSATVQLTTSKSSAYQETKTQHTTLTIGLVTNSQGQTTVTHNDKLEDIIPATTRTTTTEIFNFPQATHVSIEPTEKSIGLLDFSREFQSAQNRTQIRFARSIRARRAEVPSTLTTESVIPPYFREIFELVQTSLYTATAAGVLIFFSSLIGICGGIFRVNGCLKFSIGALVVVIIGEMATIGFIFFAHDKASNRNKYRNFHEDFKILCTLAHFCINEMMLIMVGSFLCLSVVLQTGSIALSCHLMDNVNEYDMDYAGKGWRKGALNRADLQMTNSMVPFANPMAMQMPYYSGQNMLHPFSMHGMGYFHQPMYTGPGQRPVINIIS